MAYTQVNSRGETYYLHEFDAELRGGRVYRRHFFCKYLSAKGTPLAAVPAGHIVVENPRTGLLVLKREVAAVSAVQVDTSLGAPLPSAA